MGSTPATANQPLYEKLRNQGYTKGDAAAAANAKPLRKKAPQKKAAAK